MKVDGGLKRDFETTMAAFGHYRPLNVAWEQAFDAFQSYRRTGSISSL